MNEAVHSQTLSRGKSAEELFLREIENVEPNDQAVVIFAETAVINLGNAECEGDETWAQQVAWGNQALRLLRALPPAEAQIFAMLQRKAPLPKTKRRLWQFVFLAIDTSDKSEHYMKFAGGLMHKKIVVTEQDKKNFEDLARNYFTNNINRRIWKFSDILRKFAATPQSEHVFYRFMLRFVSKFGKSDDFKKLIQHR